MADGDDDDHGVMSELVFIRHAESMNNILYRLCRESADVNDTKAFLELIQERRSADPAITPVGERQALHLAEYLTSTSLSTPLGSCGRDVILVSPMKRTLMTLAPTLNLLREKHRTAPKVIVHGGWFEQGGLHSNKEASTAMLGLAKADMLSLLSPTGEGVEFVGFEGHWACGALTIRTPQVKKQKVEKAGGWHINR